MGKRNRKQQHQSMMFKGFRSGVVPQYKLDLKMFEKQKILTNLQNQIVQSHLDKCTISKQVEALTKDKKVKKDKEGNTIMLEEITIKDSPIFIARLVNLLDRPVVTAKINQYGKEYEAPKELTKEEIEELNKQAISEKNKEIIVENETVVKKLEEK